MKNNIFPVLLGAVLTLIVFSSCEKDDPVIPNEEELITTLRMELMAENSSETLEFVFTDLDGDGGQDPVITVPELTANTIYDARLFLFNELADPAEEVTNEIETEAVDHQFFFASDIEESVEFSYQDMDVNGNPIGLELLITTKEAKNGKMTITLRHEPDKYADGVAAGIIDNAGGETDIEVVFDLIIK